jgi:hypothetical protein
VELFSPKIILPSEIGMGIKVVLSVTMMRLLNIFFFQCRFARSIWSIIQVAFDLYPQRSVANIFGNWLHGIDNRFRTLIRVGALAVIWSLWLYRNDKVFNNKVSSPLQVIYRCTGTLRLWSSLQRVEHQGLFIEVCAQLESTARDIFSHHGWQHNLRIGPS